MFDAEITARTKNNDAAMFKNTVKMYRCSLINKLAYDVDATA